MEKRTDQRVFWHGKLKKESRKTWQAMALTALCSVALFCLLFSYKKMYPFGDGSVAITDLYSQYLPLLYHFYDVVTGQKNLFLDFSVSGGANLYADTINEVLNPFNYVLLLFGGTGFIRRSMCWCCFTALHRRLQRIFFWKKQHRADAFRMYRSPFVTGAVGTWHITIRSSSG